jgi:hypothetical protein
LQSIHLSFSTYGGIAQLIKTLIEKTANINQKKTAKINRGMIQLAKYGVDNRLKNVISIKHSEIHL